MPNSDTTKRLFEITFRAITENFEELKLSKSSKLKIKVNWRLTNLSFQNRIFINPSQYQLFKLLSNKKSAIILFAILLWHPPNVFIYDRDQYIYWHFSSTCMFIARLQIKNKTRIWMGNINLSKRRQALLLEFHNFLSNVLVSAIFLKEQVTYLETVLKHSIVEKTYTMSTSHFYLDEKSTFVVVIKVTCFFCFFFFCCCCCCCFAYQGFLHRNWRFTGQQGKGGDHLLFHSTTSTRSRTLRYLFATLHVRWL